MLIKRRFAIAFIVAALLTGVFSVAHAADIAVIHSSEVPSRWTDAFVRGLADGLGDAASIEQGWLGPPDRGDDFFETRFEVLGKQFSDTEPAVVITDGSTAFSFIRKYRESLFPGVPVVYCSIPRPEPEYLGQCGECTGIPMPLSMRETVHLIFRLRPDTTTVVGIMDGSPESLKYRREVEAAMEPYLDRAEIVFPGHEYGDEGGLDAELIRTVANSVPRRGAVLFLGFDRDNAGKQVDPAAIVETLVARSAAPVFGLTDQWIGSGMLGGVMVRAQAQGKAAAKVVQRILAGEPASEMLPEAVHPVPVIDFTALARFGIQSTRLSGETVAVNVPQHPEEPSGAISTGTVLGLAGVAFLVLIAVAIRRRSGCPRGRKSGQ
ncbi:hypothetical protein [uncultured Pseudodesulfovibrio sp.]|uniref:ABC transporter substrate-binding protein n=1 Tax=uncultured Pseudodesulfovibrio sp. TaxID=2035858 RepID=UPI0029C8D09F|nr:hypothetical protein [uncultured Pseudodesulfovibrio sp.]